MKGNFDASLKMLLKHEGGFVNHPKDPGGMTNLGVTRATYEQYLGRAVSEAEMRALTPDNVGPLYKRLYWDKVRADDLPAGLDHAVFDMAVNSGPARAAKFLQRIVGVPEDGAIGPKTLAAVAAHDPADLIADFCQLRLNFLMNLPTWSTFGKGWGRRVAEVESQAQELVA